MSAKAQKEKLLGTMLVIWFSIEIYIVILENCLPSSLMGTIIRYLTYCIFFLAMFFIEARCFNRSMMLFCLLYVGMVLFNAMLVSYRRYVIVEGICSFLSYLPMLVIVSSSSFNLEKTFHQWFTACCINTVALLFVWLLYLNGTVSYGVISVVTYTNVIVLFFLYQIKSENKIQLLLLLSLNFMVGLIWGSRMPSVAAFITFIFMFFYYGSFSKKKGLILIAGVFATILVLIFLTPILNEIIKVLHEFGFNSRSLELFVNDFGSKDLFEMSKSSGRENIWSIVSEFLRTNWIFPNGFGVVRALTGGNYYYAHNIFFDFLIVGGIFSIYFVLAIICKLINGHHRLSKHENFLILSFLIFFFLRSLTGASFLGDKYFVLSVALLFLYKKGTK